MEKKVRILTAVLSVCAGLLSVSAGAQTEAAEFTADRPGATTGPSVLPRGRVQLETGIGWERVGFDNNWTTNWTANTSLLRWGFSDFAELRVQGDFLVMDEGNGPRFRMDNVIVGTKAKLYEGGRILPETSLIANVLIPGPRGSVFLTEHWGGQVGLLFENTLAPWCSLGYEVDMILRGQPKPDVFFGFCLGFEPWERITLQLEEFNLAGESPISCWAELSGAWRVSKRVQLDLSADFSLNAPQRYILLMFGVSWQITKR